MQNDYSEQDTERVRQTERAAMQQPGPLWSALPGRGALTRAGNERSNLAALALIGIGVLMLLGRVVPGQGEVMGGIILLTIASCFLFFAFWQRVYGLLIPGCLLAGLSIGITFAFVSGGVSVLWGLALGFLAILFVGRSWFNVHNQWPIYPAVPLFAVGVIAAAAQLPRFFVGGLIWLPLLLIGTGLYLGWRRA